ncbi:MAG: glycosyl hydrolase, partial [Pseudomonadota bacterium]
LAAPGDYTVSLSKRVRGETTELVAAKPFKVERLRGGALPSAMAPAETVAFWERLSKLQRSVSAAGQSVNHMAKKMDHLKAALSRSRSAPDALDARWRDLRTAIYEIEEALSGNQSMNEVGQETSPTIQSRLGKVLTGTRLSTYGPTATHLETVGYVEEDFAAVRDRINALQETDIPAFEAALIEAGAPWTPGGLVPAQQ